MDKKIKLNITENRKQEIIVFGFQNIDSNYHFFYDETNNIRKLILKNDSTNIGILNLHKNFVLGGIVYEGINKLTIEDYQKLKDVLRIDKNNKDVKFKHIAKGDFLNSLKSKKLNTFLTWIIKNNLYFHYSSLNILYWSIVDIIESSVEYCPYFQFEDLNIFKTLFYEFATIDLNNFIYILHKYDYPNVEQRKNKKFINELIKYIDKYKNFIDDEKIADKKEIQILIDILRYAKQKELVFIENNVPLELIDEFGIFYQRPLGLFINSQHIFDEEKQVIDYFEQFSFCDGDKVLSNYKFKKSDECFYVQLSDISVGLIGKFMTFLNQLKMSEINIFIDQLNPLQIENLKLIFIILKKSYTKCNAFIHYISPITTLIKINKIEELLNQY